MSFKKVTKPKESSKVEGSGPVAQLPLTKQNKGQAPTAVVAGRPPWAKEAPTVPDAVVATTRARPASPLSDPSLGPKLDELKGMLTGLADPKDTAAVLAELAAVREGVESTVGYLSSPPTTPEGQLLGQVLTIRDDGHRDAEAVGLLFLEACSRDGAIAALKNLAVAFEQLGSPRLDADTLGALTEQDAPYFMLAVAISRYK